MWSSAYCRSVRVRRKFCFSRRSQSGVPCSKRVRMWKSAYCCSVLARRTFSSFFCFQARSASVSRWRQLNNDPHYEIPQIPTLIKKIKIGQSATQDWAFCAARVATRLGATRGHCSCGPGAPAATRVRRDAVRSFRSMARTRCTYASDTYLLTFPEWNFSLQRALSARPT